MTQKKTVGEASQELLTKQFDTRDPIELEREMQQNYLNEVHLCVERGKKKFHGPFYVVVITKKEPLMPNVIRQYFLPRASCPIPEYDQTVFRYLPREGLLDYLWTVPDKETTDRLRAFALEVVPEERELRDMAIAFGDGTLDRQAAILNGESIDAPGVTITPIA